MNGRDAQARRALDVERIDLRDGSILFKFKVQNEPAVSAEEERLLAMEVEKRLWGDTKTNDNVIARWFMTVKYLASTLSFENALVYVATTPFRMVFWSLAYVLRAVFGSSPVARASPFAPRDAPSDSYGKSTPSSPPVPSAGSTLSGA